MTLRDRIEQAKARGARIRTDADFAEKSYKSEKERLAREKAQLEARQILEGLPALVMERSEQGYAVNMSVCDIGSISSLEELRRSFDHAGNYVFRALEAEGYKLSIGIDCSGNFESHNSLMCQF